MNKDTTLGRRELNKRQTRERLLNAAREVLAAEGQGGTVEEIAERAEVSRATFFNYFPSKDDLLAALYETHMDSLTRVVDDLLARETTTQARIVGLFTDFVREAEALPGYLRAMTLELERISTSPQVVAARGDRFTAQIVRIVDLGVRRGEVRTDHPPQFLAQMVSAIYLSTIRYWHHDPAYDFVGTFAKAGLFVAESLAPVEK
ncbi:TetR/AcrR family transcriptional regulator [Rhodococcus sp. D2-41]|uniref:TetR/AcrR family transcriptional regulator n=1 Tax=Speluncibacter jeojiensis TaxID=2710754 RepID=UPI00240EC0DD|nr:TetR/AcrR family transcriptional regulator [Rhodococcus sp. D2-41]MDG3012051.1 TetR/AcrR family transcriptional regulator [Rhodococcus sp. D2-41]